MYRINNLQTPLEATTTDLKKLTAKKLRLSDEQLRDFNIAKKSVDARNKNNVHFVYSVDCNADNIAITDKDIEILPPVETLTYKIKDTGLRPVVIGSGPAGMFAGIALAEAGLKPIIIERGSEVDTRQCEVDTFWKIGNMSMYRKIDLSDFE